MGPLEFISTTLIVTILATSINAQCSPEDLQQRRETCKNTANSVLNTQRCSGLEEGIKAVLTCYSACNSDNIPKDYLDEWESLKNSVNQAVMSRCSDDAGPAEARNEGPAAACDFVTVIGCVGNLGSLINIPVNADFNSLKGVCSTINSVSGFLNTCGTLVADCIGLGNVFVNELNQIRYAIKVGNELQQGGCTCLTELEPAINAYASLPQSTEVLKTTCIAVQATSRALKTVLDTCISRINRAVGGTTLDWVQITMSYINIANPFVLFTCGAAGIINAAVAIGLGFLTACAAGLLQLYMKLRTQELWF